MPVADVFIDGVRDAGSQTRDIFALEQIEVIKGPAPAYSGRGSSGGAVNLVDQEGAGREFPAQRTWAAARTAYGRAARSTRTTDSRTAIALRLNASCARATCRAATRCSTIHVGVAPSLAFGLGRPTRVDLDYYHYRTDDMPDYSIPYGRNADNSAPRVRR